MAKTIVTQFGEFLNYDNLVRIGIITNWEDAEIDEESGTITPDYEMIGTDTAGNQIPMGIYATPDDAEAALKDLHDWLGMEAYAVYAVNTACRSLRITKVQRENPTTSGRWISFIFRGSPS